MKTYPRILVAGAVLAIGACLPALAATLDQVLQAAEQINQDARDSQKKMDAIAERSRDILNDYRQVLKETDGLRVYNAQLQKQIDSQRREMDDIKLAIDEVTVIERQITPLMLRMVEGIDQFVSNDTPFLNSERRERIGRLREIMDRGDVPVSEKLSQIFTAYQIENDYGRSMQAYSDTIENLSVDVLRVGRVVLLYQTKDGGQSKAWDQEQKSWTALDSSYNSQIRTAIRMANKQVSMNLVILPVKAPGA